jgi:protein gp37
MGKTDIAWTEMVWNPTRGCSRVSAGCGDGRGGGCYAERMAGRFSGPGGAFEGLTRGGRWTGKVRLLPEALEIPLRWRKPRRIFVDSMSDLFHPEVPDEFIHRVCSVIARCPQHTFQLLTKRAKRMHDFFACWMRPPPPNLWVGVSVEDQAAADERIPLLLATPAEVRFLSIEPMLGPVELRGLGGICIQHPLKPAGVCMAHVPDISWVICGAESGPGARPCDLEWIRDIVRQCKEAGVACFVKQLGARPVSRSADDRRHCGDMLLPDRFRLMLRDRAGADPAEWPKDLRVREMPQSEARR